MSRTFNAFRIGLTAGAFIHLSLSAAAEQSDAGGLQGQIEQRLKPVPVRTPKSVAKTARFLLPAPDGVLTLAVNSFEFEGNSRMSREQLAAIVAPYQGRAYSIEQLRQITNIVADAYRDAGFLVRVSLPKQQVQDGVVRLEIIEASFGKTVLQGRQSRIASALLQAMVEDAQPSGQPVQVQGVDRALLLLDGIPGLSVSGSLVEGEQPGQTDLVLSVADLSSIRGDITLDNTGAPSTGGVRVLANLSLHSPLGVGDQLQLTALKTQGSDFERLGWTLPMGVAGMRAGVHATRLAYKLVGSFTDLNSRGAALGHGLDISYPWLRSQTQNIYISANYDVKRFDNDANGVSVSRYGIDVFNAALSATQSDDWLGGGHNSFSLGWSQGKVNLSGSPNQPADASGPATAGEFSKLRFSLSRLQAITPSLSGYVALNVQRANKNLDSSERIFLGGVGGVRAYPSSEGGGSEGQIFTVELRQQLAANWSLTSFFDHGQVKAFKNNSWADGSGKLNSASAPNDLAIKGYGVSLTWAPQPGAELRATLARRIGTNPLANSATGTDSDGTLKLNRLWLSATFAF